MLLEGSFDAPTCGARASAAWRTWTLDVPVAFTLNLVPESLVRGEDYLDEDEDDGEGQGESEGSFELEDADEERLRRQDDRSGSDRP